MSPGATLVRRDQQPVVGHFSPFDAAWHKCDEAHPCPTYHFDFLWIRHCGVCIPRGNGPILGSHLCRSMRNQGCENFRGGEDSLRTIAESATARMHSWCSEAHDGLLAPTAAAKNLDE